MSPGPAGAQCAVHVGIAAPATCSRCGNFMCLSCSENGSQRECPSCRALRPTDFPLNADAKFAQIWDYCLDAFQREWLMLCICMLIVVGAFVLVGGVSGLVRDVVCKQLGIHHDPARPFDDVRGFLTANLILQIITPVFSIPANALVLTGAYRVLLDVLRGKRADVARVFVRVDLFPRFAMVHLLVWAMTSVPLVIFFCAVGFVTLKIAGTTIDSPGLLRAISQPKPVLLMTLSVLTYIVALSWLLPLYFFAPLEILVSECQPLEAVRRAAMLGEGERVRLLGYSLVTVALLSVGFIACCVGVLPGYGFSSMLFCAVFLVVRKGSVLPPPLT